jgi:hypothetical protein
LVPSFFPQDFLDAARTASTVKFELSGALGKRTKFQQDAIAQVQGARS